MALEQQPMVLPEMKNLVFVVAFLSILGSRDSYAAEACHAETEALQVEAERGSGSAQTALGSRFENGICVAKDQREAMRWYEKAYAKGDLLAGHKLATIYLDTVDPALRNPKRAVQILTKNSEAGFAYSQTTLGQLYAEGVVLKRDYRQAYEWWLRAAEKDKVAKYNLALLYDNGHGVERNPNKAFTLMKEAADAGYRSADYELCRTYINGDRFGVTSDMKRAFPHCYTGAKMGDMQAAVLLALIYLKTGEPNKGLEWLRRSAESGYPDAEYAFGKILLTGSVDIVRNETEGLNYLSRAAKQGHTGAVEEIRRYNQVNHH